MPREFEKNGVEEVAGRQGFRATTGATLRDVDANVQERHSGEQEGGRGGVGGGGGEREKEKSDLGRMGSVVSLEERCEPYEGDLEAASDCPQRRRTNKKPPALTSLRYYIMAIALVSPFIVTYSKTIINFAIISMIHPDFVGRGSQQRGAALLSTTRSPFLEPSSSFAPNSSEAVDGETLSRTPAYFELDDSCPVSEQVRSRLLAGLSEDKRRAQDTPGEKFEWDTDKQGLLKAAYSIGHMTLQVIGGRLSEIYGPQLIMSASAGLIALSCLSAPLLASCHFYLLFADLFLLGILGGFMTPSLITLFTNWLTPSEKSMMMSFYLVSSRLGYALSSLLCGLLMDAQLSWRYLFYSAGWIALFFALAFFVCSRNTPQDHPLVRQPELDYLASKNTLVREALARRAATSPPTELKAVGAAKSETIGTKATTATQEDAKSGVKRAAASGRSAPWAAILTNLPVWAFILTKFCVKLAGDTVQTELPAYLQRVMHLEPKYNGYINSANYFIFCVSCIAIGMLAKSANKKHPFGLSKTAIRKFFQCTASFGVSLVLLGVSFSVCHENLTLGLFMLMFFVTTFSTGGEAQIPLDLSERYAGTIHAIGSSLAISGAIEPIIVGYFLRGHASDRYRWENIWLAASGVGFLGGLMFLVFGEAKIQPFDSIGGQSSRPVHDEPDNQHEKASSSRAVAGHLNKTSVLEDKRSNGNSSSISNNKKPLDQSVQNSK